MSPYATALRLGARTVADAARTLAAADAVVQQLAGRLVTVEADLRRETSVICETYILPVHPFHAHRRSERDRVRGLQAAALEQLALARQALATAQARQTGLEEAQDAWQRDRQRQRDRAAQAAADDRSAAQIVMRRQR